MTSTHKTAQERREALQANARRLGIDETFISQLVDTFYGRIRQNDRLGPIFEHAIEGDWDHHLSRMKDFWASVAANTGQYSGRPVPKHQKLEQVRPEDFEIWLSLFEQTLKDLTKNEEVIPYFMDRANRIAESLKLAMFGIPDLPPMKYPET